jgi:hypothetical protein
MLPLSPGGVVTSRHRRGRNVIWLTPESLQAAERLSGLTGISVPELIEVVLLELMEHEAMAEPRREEDPPAPPARAPRRGPARVIPIEGARLARRRPAPTAAAAQSFGSEELRERCQLLRAQAERARLAAVKARERARVVLQGRRGGND